jgi:hypothetical protein
MNCREYAPLVSRYLDEDLEGKELLTFFDHLSGCKECRKEMEAVERLRGWLQAADAYQGIPEVRGGWGLEDLLRREASLEGSEPLETLGSTAGRVAPAQGRAWPRSKEWIKSNLFPFPIVPRQVMGFALPLLLVAVVAAWLYARQTAKWIDVSELQALPTGTASFTEEEGDEIEYYVVQHASHQPWEQYGDEVPILQLASVPPR